MVAGEILVPRMALMAFPGLKQSVEFRTPLKMQKENIMTTCDFCGKNISRTFTEKDDIHPIVIPAGAHEVCGKCFVEFQASEVKIGSYVTRYRATQQERWVAGMLTKAKKKNAKAEPKKKEPAKRGEDGVFM